MENDMDTQLEEAKNKSLQEILEDGTATLSLVFKDQNAGGATVEQLKKMLDNVAWFVNIFNFTLVGIDKETMLKLQKEGTPDVEAVKE
jgi:hypothetical protein